ncbi:MAG: DUF2795 domain-containing protein [Ignavibacteria bacterium]|nr:DUF2795 domain-containing protein [Ignavibacteria bacterium]
MDYATRTGSPQEVIENLRDLEETDEPYESIEEIWLDYPTKEDFFYDDEEKDF